MATLLEVAHRYRFNLDQQRWVLESILERADRVRHSAAAGICTSALEVVHHGVEIQRDYHRERGPQPDGRDANDLNNRIGTTLRSINEVIEGWAQMGRANPYGREAGDLLNDAFPRGLFDHARAQFTTQLGMTDSLVEVLRSRHRAAFVAMLGIAPLIDELVQLNEQFRAQVQPERSVTYDDVVAATKDGEQVLLRAIFFIASSFEPLDKAQATARDTMLLPYFTMMRRIRRQMKDRHRRGIKAHDAANRPSDEDVVDANDTDPEVAPTEALGTAGAHTDGPTDASPEDGAAIDAPITAAMPSTLVPTKDET